MSSSDFNARLSAAKEEHQDAIIEKLENSTERYDVVRDKTSQAHNSVNNTFAFMDKATDVKFTISVSVTTTKSKADPKLVLGADELKQLQKIISKFLANIHTNI